MERRFITAVIKSTLYVVGPPQRNTPSFCFDLDNLYLNHIAYIHHRATWHLTAAQKPVLLAPDIDKRAKVNHIANGAVETQKIKAQQCNDTYILSPLLLVYIAGTLATFNYLAK